MTVTPDQQHPNGAGVNHDCMTDFVHCRRRVHQPHPTTPGAPLQHGQQAECMRPLKCRLNGTANFPESPQRVLSVATVALTQKPQKLRHLLEQHGELGRLYLAPEAPSLRAKRKRHKGNTGKNFTEGWVEFEDKCVAKQVGQTPCCHNVPLKPQALALHQTIMTTEPSCRWPAC